MNFSKLKERILEEYKNAQAYVVLEEATKCPKVKGFKSNANIVKSWSEKYNVNPSVAALFWRRAELLAAKSAGDCKKIPYGLAVEIFKASFKKYLSKCDPDIKYAIDNPEIKGKKLKIHYDEAKKYTLDEIIEMYKQDVKRLEKECRGQV